jgi:hypothetical protein
MNLIRAIRRPAGILLWLATVALASLTAAPAALAAPRPRPSGWNKHPPPPAHVHPLATAIPGWQLTLMAVTIVLLAAVVVAIAYPGPGRTAARERTHRLSEDRIRCHADPHGQPAGLARSALARRNHQAGPRP